MLQTLNSISGKSFNARSMPRPMPTAGPPPAKVRARFFGEVMDQSANALSRLSRKSGGNGELGFPSNATSLMQSFAADIVYSPTLHKHTIAVLAQICCLANSAQDDTRVS